MSDAAYQVQTMLSMLGYRPGGLDGDQGAKTNAALREAGLGTLPLEQAAEALAQRIERLRASVPYITLAQYKALAPKGRSSWIGPLNLFLSQTLTTRARLPMVLAQLGHESGGFRYAVEQGVDSSARYYPHIGRGPLQITWEDNYNAAGDFIGTTLTGSAERRALLELPAIGFQAAAWYWLHHNLQALVDVGDFEGLTRAINGGLNGYADRQHRLAAAQSLFPRRGGPTGRRPDRSSRRTRRKP